MTSRVDLERQGATLENFGWISLLLSERTIIIPLQINTMNYLDGWSAAGEQIKFWLMGARWRRTSAGVCSGPALLWSDGSLFWLLWVRTMSTVLLLMVFLLKILLLMVLQPKMIQLIVHMQKCCPAKSSPAESSPTDGSPTDGSPTECFPAECSPAERSPVGGSPSEGSPANGSDADVLHPKEASGDTAAASSSGGQAGGSREAATSSPPGFSQLPWSSEETLRGSAAELRGQRSRLVRKLRRPLINLGCN